MGRGDDGMKCIEVRTLLKKGAYADALDVVETININKVRSIVNLKAIASAYERVGEYAKAKAVLLQSYDIKRTKMTVYRLAYLSIKTEEFEDAEAFYQEFTEMAPDSPDRYILRYGIDRAKNVDYVLRIATLQKLKQIEYTEEWGYELAKIYHKAGLHEECIRECRDLIIWFGSGVIVDKAKLLCKYHQEGRESLDAYGVFEQDATPEQVRERREKFHVDTEDFGRQTELVVNQAKEEELRRQIDLDMEKTVDLRQVMGAEGDQFDLLKQEVHRVWGNASEEHKALQEQRKKAQKQVAEQTVIEPEPRPMYRRETEEMLAASIAKVMDKANKGELFSGPKMQEIMAEDLVNSDAGGQNAEPWMEENVDTERIPQVDSGETSSEITEEEPENFVERSNETVEEPEFCEEDSSETGKMEPYEEGSSETVEREPESIEENFGETVERETESIEESFGEAVKEPESLEESFNETLEEKQESDEESSGKILETQKVTETEDTAVVEKETAKGFEQAGRENEMSVAQRQESVPESTEETPVEESKEDSENHRKLGKHARRNARRAAKREKAKKAAAARKAEQSGTVPEILETERVETIPKAVQEEKEEPEAATDSQLEPLSEESMNVELENSEEMLMAAVDEVMAEIEEEKEKAMEEAKASEEEQEPEEPDFIDEYGMTLWEYFEKYQQDTRLCEDIYDSLEKAMKGKRPLNFIITCKNKERYAELGRDIAKALKALGLKEKQQVGRIDAEKLNRMHLEKNYEKIQGGCILVEEARKITADTAQSIMNMINELSDQVVVILCDARPYMKDLLDEYPMMKRYFPFDIAMK